MMAPIIDFITKLSIMLLFGRRALAQANPLVLMECSIKTYSLFDLFVFARIVALAKTCQRRKAAH